jgi:periplasmic divalent cation tolerance protein
VPIEREAMSNTDYQEFVVTCASWQEAQAIADVLLEKRLIACAEFIEIKSKYRWQETLEEANEIKLIMKTIANNFKKVEAEIAKLHSYKAFVLQALPVLNTSKEAENWLAKELK